MHVQYALGAMMQEAGPLKKLCFPDWLECSDLGNSEFSTVFNCTPICTVYAYSGD